MHYANAYQLRTMVAGADVTPDNTQGYDGPVR